MKYINLVLLASMIFLSFGCAQNAGYMGSNEPVTRMECEMQYITTVKAVEKGYKYVMTNEVWNKVVECAHLPETIF